MILAHDILVDDLLLCCLEKVSYRRIAQTHEILVDKVNQDKKSDKNNSCCGVPYFCYILDIQIIFDNFKWSKTSL